MISVVLIRRALPSPFPSSVSREITGSKATLEPEVYARGMVGSPLKALDH